MSRFDLRSDTVTEPSPEMRAVMARAAVGDDVYREDPSARELEERVAAILGKEAALFVPSGTMSNQIALLVHTERGSEVIVGEGAHVANYEAGAGAAWSGVQFVMAGRGGTFSAEEMQDVVRPALELMPRTSLVSLENTHNRGGGRVFPQTDVLAIAAAARATNLPLHLDGARLWNAAVATGLAEAELAAPFDSVNVCFSKGLGAPVGSALAGSRALIERARRFRKMLGGAMRQCGVLAAAALYALDHHRGRLAEDHESARRLATALAGSAHVRCDPRRVETNIVIVELDGAWAEQATRDAARLGILMHPISPRSLRLVTHLDFPVHAAQSVGERLVEVIERVAASQHAGASLSS